MANIISAYFADPDRKNIAPPAAAFARFIANTAVAQ